MLWCKNKLYPIQIVLCHRRFIHLIKCAGAVCRQIIFHQRYPLTVSVFFIQQRGYYLHPCFSCVIIFYTYVPLASQRLKSHINLCYPLSDIFAVCKQNAIIFPFLSELYQLAGGFIGGKSQDEYCYKVAHKRLAPPPYSAQRLHSALAE